MNQQSSPRSQQCDTDKAVLLKLDFSSLEAVNGGMSVDGCPGCGTRAGILNPQPLPPRHDNE